MLAMLAMGQPPAMIAARPDFSGAVGRKVEITIRVEPAIINLNEAATLFIAFTNVDYPAEVKRPTLQLWKTNAAIERTVENRRPDKVEFQYHIRPRTVGEQKWPRLKLESYNPGAPESRQVQTHYLKLPPLMVTEDMIVREPKVAIPFHLLEKQESSNAIPIWLWAITVPFVVIAIPVLSKLWEMIRRTEHERKVNLANHHLNRLQDDPRAIQERIPMVFDLFSNLKLDVSPLTRLADRLRFRPDGSSQETVEFFDQARRMLSP